MQVGSPLLCFFGHHKCATKYILSIVRRVCRECGLKFANGSSMQAFHGDLEKFASDYQLDFLSYTNAQWKHVPSLGNFRGFHVVRDPRDILVSAYFSHLHSHATQGWPELAVHRARLQQLNKFDGLMLELEFCGQIFQSILDWNYEHPDILEIRFEQLIANPRETFLAVFEHLGIQMKSHCGTFGWLLAIFNGTHRNGRGPNPFRIPTRVYSKEFLIRCIQANQFESKSNGRIPGEENIHHHYRKGIPGDWVHHLSPEHIQGI